MAQNVEIHTADVIERALKAPLDWGKFEDLAHALLVADDLPTLRKIGGIGDLGMDAVEEVFYDAERRVKTVVQVTSAQGQRAKVRDTLAKLSKNNITMSTLVFLTRHPVSSSTRKEMIDEADEGGVSLDVRDESYLVAMLGKQPATFLRFFGSTKAQITAMLEGADPLRTVSDRLQHALLATLGAYVLSDHARLARGSLFDKTVLSALAAMPDGRATKAELLPALRSLLPGEQDLMQQIESAVDRLRRSGDCSVDNATIVCGEAVLKKCLNAASAASLGFSRLLDYILLGCKGVGQLTDAHIGYIERNLRRAIVQLLRVAGPLKSDDDNSLDFGPDPSNEVKDIIGADLPIDVGRAALMAFASYVQDRTKAASLAPLVRTYAALAIRNMDPMGRRWQRSVLARSMIALDTDALLYVIVEELPEHSAILAALKRMQAEDVDIVVPEHVFEEAVGHLERAPRTYRLFADRLLKFPKATVDARVWHAVVRGYYYARQAGNEMTFETYYTKYYNEERSSEYTQHILSKRLPLKMVCLDRAPIGEEASLYELENLVMEYREHNRRKATFRDPIEMANRVRADVAMALTLSAKSGHQMGAPAKGYVASSDSTFRWMENNAEWKNRKSVHLWTAALPELSNFSCGSTQTPQDSVELLFNSIAIAAAELMEKEINVLTSIGIDLKDAPLDRLDWDLSNSLKNQLSTLELAVGEAKTDYDEPSAIAALDVARAAVDAGYLADPQLKMIADEFNATKESAATERQKRVLAEEQLRKLVQLTREQSTNKPRRRFNKLLFDLGIHFEDSDESEDDGRN